MATWTLGGLKLRALIDTPAVAGSRGTVAGRAGRAVREASPETEPTPAQGWVAQPGLVGPGAEVGEPAVVASAPDDSDGAGSDDSSDVVSAPEVARGLLSSGVGPLDDPGPAACRVDE